MKVVQRVGTTKCRQGLARGRTRAGGGNALQSDEPHHKRRVRRWKCDANPAIGRKAVLSPRVSSSRCGLCLSINFGNGFHEVCAHSQRSTLSALQALRRCETILFLPSPRLLTIFTRLPSHPRSLFAAASSFTLSLLACYPFFVQLSSHAHFKGFASSAPAKAEGRQKLARLCIPYTTQFRRVQCRDDI